MTLTIPIWVFYMVGIMVGTPFIVGLFIFAYMGFTVFREFIGK